MILTMLGHFFFPRVNVCAFLIAGTFKSTKPEKGGPGPITSLSIGTQGHAWASDG